MLPQPPDFFGGLLRFQVEIDDVFQSAYVKVSANPAREKKIGKPGRSRAGNGQKYPLSPVRTNR